MKIGKLLNFIFWIWGRKYEYFEICIKKGIDGIMYCVLISERLVDGWGKCVVKFSNFLLDIYGKRGRNIDGRNVWEKCNW